MAKHWGETLSASYNKYEMLWKDFSCCRKTESDLLKLTMNHGYKLLFFNMVFDFGLFLTAPYKFSLSFYSHA